MLPNHSLEGTLTGKPRWPQSGVVHHPLRRQRVFPARAPQFKRSAARPITLPPRAALHMLRALIYGLTILHLGPGIAFALLAFGCEQPEPYLGGVCGKGGLSSFGLLTVGAWLVLLVALAALRLVQRSRTCAPPNTAGRVLALLAVLATGALLGAAGAWLTGSQYWFLAIPGALALGWLFLANPLGCTAKSQASEGTAGPSSAA